MREDKQLLILTHLSQLLNHITGVGGFIVFLFIWITQKDKVQGMDYHGKKILNFQLSMFIYGFICVPLVFLCGLGFVLLVVIAILLFIFPVLNAIKASNGEEPFYPFSIKFL